MAVPEPEEFSALIQSIGTLSTDVRELRRETERENHKRDRRIRLSRILIMVALLAAVTGLVVGAAGVIIGAQARHAVQEVKKNRAEARVASCLEENKSTVKHNTLVMTIEDVFRGFLQPDPRDPPRTAEEQARTEEYAHKQIAVFESTVVPLRDCSPEGIAKYLSTAPTTTSPR